MQSSTSSTPKTSHSNGSVGDVPGWLKALGVERGGFYTSTKARPRRLMKNPLSAEARQVYACLELATMGYQQELAVKMHKGRQVPLTPTDIAEQTGLSRQHVRRALEELEDHGLAARRPIAGNGLTKGNVAIYSWAVPREPKDQDCSHRAATMLDLDQEFQSLTSFIQRWKIKPDPGIEPSRGSLLQALEAVANAERANMEAVAIVKGVIAPQRYKEERNREKPFERNPPPQPSANGSNSQHSKAEEEEDFRSDNRTEPTPPEPPAPSPPEPQPEKKQDLYQQFKSAYPKDHFDEPRAKPLFRGLKPAAQQRALDRLRNVYLTCERWQDDNGRWIPLASNFLQNGYYDAEPPPLIRKQHASGSDERILKMMRGET